MTAIAALAAFAGACASPATRVPGDSASYPSGRALVLGVRHQGGLLPPATKLREIPTFTLVGDGRFITNGAQIDIYPSPALPSVTQRTITAEGVQAILRAAEDAGLTEGDRTVGLPDGVGVMDAGETVFTVTMNGKTSVTRVEALGAVEESGERAKIREFQEKLGDLERWLPAGSFSDERMYEFRALRVVSFTYETPDASVKQDPKAWPLATPLRTFGEPLDGGPARNARCGVVSGGDFDRLLPAVRESNELTPWTSEGNRYQLALRPLLPNENETAC